MNSDGLAKEVRRTANRVSVPAKYVFKEITDLSEDGSETLLSVSEYYGVSPRAEHIDSSEHLTRAESLIGYKRCRPGDLVMNIMLAWKRALGASDYGGIVSPAYAVFRPDTTHINPRFMHYLLRDDLYVSEFMRHSTGVVDSRLRLYPEVFLGIQLILPALSEQTRIANFLDEQTARIDALIAEKERLDGLLGEYRASLISAAVTGQVDLGTGATLPRAHVGAGGVSRWPTTRLRYIADLNPAARPELLRAPETEVSFLPMEAIGEDGSLNLERTRPVSDVRNGYSYFEEGDVAFAKVTPCFENGKGALMSGLEGAAGFGTTELTVLRPKQGTAARFLHYVVQSSIFRQFGAAAMTGAGGLKRVPDEFTRDFTTPWPPFVEQTRIANFLEEQTARIDALRGHCKGHITRLREYRSSLVSAAVTGQLDIDKFKRSAT